MINQEIAQLFYNMSSYLQMDSSKNAFFKARALRKAGEVVDRFPHDLSDPKWHKDISKLKKIEGIGESTANHIKEYIETGKIKEYEIMKKKSPVKLEELLKIQGIGPKTVMKLYKELKVTDINSLKKVAEAGQIAELEGFGQRSQEKILDSIKFAITNKDRKLFSETNEVVKNLKEYMFKDKTLKSLEVVGSYRRRSETVGDIDILVYSNNPKKTMKHFTTYADIEKILAKGETKSSVWLKSKIQADIRIVPKDSFGAALQYFTGSKEHNIKLRNVAISKGYKLSEYGLFSRKDETKKVEGESEKKIYKKLGLQYIEPELRENTGEIEAAKTNNLPNLIDKKDINGDLQMHTTWSDGVNTIEEMAIKGVSLGYKYIGISDHFGKLKVANAIDESDFKRYLQDIKRANEKIHDIQILAGAEVEIDKEGNLEFSEFMLKELDYIISAVHFSTNMSETEMTKRLIKAIKNPLTKIIAHPTNRIIGHRPGYKFDYEKVFKAARDENVAMEINAHPARLDLNSTLTKLAKDIGCKISINTDAHSTQGMDNIIYGINVGRRGWLEKSDLYSFPVSPSF